MYLRGRYFILFAFFFILLTSCSSRYRNALFTSKDDPSGAPEKPTYVVHDSGEPGGIYRIKANDLLYVRNVQDIRNIAAGEGQVVVFQNIRYRVEGDGTVALPALGKVQVAGLTRKEAADKIQTLYKQGLLKDPIIDVSIVNLKVTMLGEFVKQGNFLLEKDNTTLVEMIGEAGGITERADTKRLKIIRGGGEKPEVIYVNLRDINSLASKKLILQNNDIVYLEPQGIYGNREKANVFSSYAQPIILLLNAALIIYNLSTR